jgi:N-acetylglucosaminyldiphosphoundecaprenol N-acetyl-beta-D-mannosaminyltransferase
MHSQPIYNGDTTFLNPFSYLQIRKNKHLAKPMMNVEIDGGLLVLLLRIFLGWKVERCSFDMTSLAPKVFKKAEETGQSLYFVGSKQEEITQALNVIKAEFPKLNIIKYRNGYFAGDEWQEEIGDVADLNPDIVIVGMGTPIQERFLIDLRKKGWSGAGFTCGGFLHQTAKGIQYYPKWIDKLNLRWMYRIYDEPKLFKRYTLDYTKFLFVFAYDVIRYKLSSRP